MIKTDYLDLCEELIFARTQVLFLQGTPGGGKTSLKEAIAKKHNLLYFDIRLAQKDSGEVGGIPEAVTYEYETVINGEKVKKEIRVTQYAVPEWAFSANNAKNMGYAGALINFDEINRAHLDVRNAALQILLPPHAIGDKFKFEDHVYFTSTGNLGTEDGCEVEEMDMALLGRLATVEFNLEIEEWVRNYAKENVHPYIISFLEKYPSYVYKTFKDEKAYCSYRSWSFLSKDIEKCGDNIDQIISKVIKLGQYRVGSGYKAFWDYLKDLKQVTILDVLDRWSEIKSVIKDMRRDKMDRLVKELTSKDITKLTSKQVNNAIKFLTEIDDDERIGILNSVLEISPEDLLNEEEDENFHPNVVKIMKAFKKDAKLLLEQAEKN